MIFLRDHLFSKCILRHSRNAFGSYKSFFSFRPLCKNLAFCKYRTNYYTIRHNAFGSFKLLSSFRPLYNNVVLSRYRANFDTIHRFGFGIGKFHTSKPCNAIPPVLVALLRPLVNIVAVVAGRGIRKWWISLTPVKRRQIYENLKKNRYKFIGGATAIYLAGYVYYTLHITEAPITKRKRFILFNKSELQQLANLQSSLLLEDYSKQLLPSDHYLYKRVASVKEKIIKANGDIPGMQDGPWSLHLVYEPHQRNAFVLPNKSIFVFTGILDVCVNDDQLAMILAHEISHVLLSHMEENLSKTHFIQMMLILPVLILWIILPNEGAVLFHWLTDKITHLMIDLPFSRNIEREADEVGLQMIAKACYDVREASKLWEKMDKIAADKDEEKPIEWLSTHPSFSNRKTYVEQQIPLAIRIREECNCPPLTGSRMR